MGSVISLLTHYNSSSFNRHTELCKHPTPEQSGETKTSCTPRWSNRNCSREIILTERRLMGKVQPQAGQQCNSITHSVMDIHVYRAGPAVVVQPKILNIFCLQLLQREDLLHCSGHTLSCWLNKTHSLTSGSCDEYFSLFSDILETQ